LVVIETSGRLGGIDIGVGDHPDVCEFAAIRIVKQLKEGDGRILRVCKIFRCLA